MNDPLPPTSPITSGKPGDGGLGGKGQNKPAKRKSRFWRKCRIYFRRARFTVWLVILGILGALIYLNLIGLPGFVKRPIITKLHERGLALDFSELKLHWARGFVASDVRFGATNDSATTPQLKAREVEFNFHMSGLLAGKIQVDALAIRGGTLEWTLPQTNALGRRLIIENIESSLRLLPNDQWILDDLRGTFGGANFSLSGSLANASAVKAWKFGGDGTTAARQWPERLRKLADTLDKIKFASPPELRLIVNGDARDLKSFDASFVLKAAEADTAWGSAEQVLLTTQIFPAATNELSRAEVSLQAKSARTPWVNAAGLDLKLRLVTFAPSPELVDAAGTIRIKSAETQWGSVGATHAKAKWVHSITNPIPQSATLELHSDSIRTLLANALQIDVSATLDTVATNGVAAQDGFGFWNKLLPYAANWSVNLGALRMPNLLAEKIELAGNWRAPELNVTAVKAELFKGSLDASARLDMVTRAASFELTSGFDLQQAAPLLTEKAREWLQKFSWRTPPSLQAAGLVALPPWDESNVDWQAALRPTLKLAGWVAITNGGYQGVQLDWVTSHFSYTNMTWWLPDLMAARPEGELRVSHISNDATRDFYFKIHSAIDPNAVLPLLDAGVRRGFDLCEFGRPPIVDGELWGSWYDHSSIGFRGSVALTNFSFRGQSTDAIVLGLNYTNLAIECIEPRVWRGTQHLSADGITTDFNSMRIYFTNGFSTLDPGMVVRAIGPQVTRVMEPYHFGQPPTARFWGYTSMNDPQDTDLTFEGSGNDFESLNFHVPEYKATVHWQNQFLTVTNTSGKFYGGHATGWAHFVFDKNDRATYAFSVDATNANLHQLVADMTKRDNTLDGLLNCLLVVTNANTEDIRSWDGYGHANLRDGLLWELPIFGALSKPLDSIIPGVGNTRFSKASGTYKIEKGVIESRNMEMRSGAMRLQYSGTVDFDGAIRVRVEAEPLRDTPVVGPIVSAILTPVAKLFSYKIRGTMSQPIIKPENIPGFLMAPFSPFQTIGNLFSPGTPANSSPTNPPPEIKVVNP